MSFDWQKIRESKDQMRRRLAALPVAEKLRMLDTMPEQVLTLRGAQPIQRLTQSQKPQ